MVSTSESWMSTLTDQCRVNMKYHHVSSVHQGVMESICLPGALAVASGNILA